MSRSSVFFRRLLVLLSRQSLLMLESDAYEVTYDMYPRGGSSSFCMLRLQPPSWAHLLEGVLAQQCQATRLGEISGR